jgi:uncharacterized protein (DUF433 family)
MATRIPYSTVLPGVDQRELPIYSPAEAAAFLDIPKATVNSWIFGRFAGPSRRWYPPIIDLPKKSRDLMSFNNLAEIHILAITTRIHKVKLAAVRSAADHVKQAYPSPHPLLSRAFYTNGRDLFVKTLEQTINVSMHGQLALKPILDLYLERIERDENFMPTKIYPITRGQDRAKVVAIIPTVSSGRPVIDGYGIPVSSIWSRFTGGDSPAFLSKDYDIPLDKIQGALAYVEHFAAAAA